MDDLGPRRNDTLSESSPVLNALLAGLDRVKDHKGIYVIRATNRYDLVDPAMLTSGRLEKIIFIDLPNPHERLEILKAITRGRSLSNVDLRAIADDPRCTDFRSVLLNAPPIFNTNIVLVGRI